MSPNVDLVYRDIDSSPALTSTIQKKLERLNRFSEDITHSRVVVDVPHNHKQKGKLFRASIELGLKGAPVKVSNDNASAHLAVRDAFNAAERKIKEASEKRRATRH